MAGALLDCKESHGDRKEWKEWEKSLNTMISASPSGSSNSPRAEWPKVFPRENLPGVNIACGGLNCFTGASEAPKADWNEIRES